MTLTTKVLISAGVAALTALAGVAVAQAPAPMAMPAPALTPVPAAMRIALVGAGGKDMGFALITEAPKGVVVRVELQGLTPGWHGMHFH